MIIRGNSWGNGKAHKFKKIHEIWKDFRSTEKNGKGRGMITLFNYPNWWTKLFLWNSSKFMMPGINTNFQGGYLGSKPCKKAIWEQIKLHWPDVFKRSNIHFEWFLEFFDHTNFPSPPFFETIFGIRRKYWKDLSLFKEIKTFFNGNRFDEWGIGQWISTQSTR